MSRAIVEQLLYLMDEAFDAKEQEHSLLTNLRSVPDDGWLWVPSGGARSIFDIVRHVGECKYVYDNHAFGDGSMRWDRPATVPTVVREAPMAAVVEWLREGEHRWRESISELEDDGRATKTTTRQLGPGL